MRLKSVLPHVLLVASLALAACGTQSPGATWERPARPEPSAPPSASPAPMPGAGAGTPSALIERGHAAFAAMAGYETEMHYMQKKGATTSEGVYLITGKQPRQLKIVIKVGKNQGTKLQWSGGKTVKVRPTGLLSAVTVDLPITDDRFKSVRGYTLDQTDIPAMFSLMRDPANRIGPSGPDAVTVTGPKLLKGVVKMQTTFDPTSGLPIKVEMSDHREPVLRIELRKFRANSHASLAI